MSEENKTQNINADFAAALDSLNKLRGKTKAYILLAVTDEPAKDGEKNALSGINSVGGKMGDLVNLYKNIGKEISIAASMGDFFGFLGKALNDKGNDNE